MPFYFVSFFKKSFKKIPKKFFIISFSIILILAFSFLEIFGNFELVFYDLQFLLRPKLKVSSDIVVIQIDDITLEKLGNWPIKRDYYAILLEALKEFGAKAVVFDILFSEASQSDESDNFFSESIKSVDFVYLPIALYIEDTKRKTYLPIQTQTISSGIFENFKKYVRGFGHINTFVDSDGKIRKIPLFIQYNQKLIPHLALKVSCDYLGLNLANVEFKGKKVIIDKKLILPISSNNAFFVNYPGRWNDTFIHFSYLEVIKAYNDFLQNVQPKVNTDIFKDKICFVGLTATGTVDLKPTPLEKLYPMLGLQASVFNSIVNKRFIYDVGTFFNTLINILIFFIAFFFCSRYSPFKSLIILIATFSIYFLLATGLFIFFGIWITVFFPFLIIIVTYLVFTLYKFFDEINKRRLLEKELEIAKTIQESFLPKDINKFENLVISALMQPAKFVAGDLYDILLLDEKKVGVFIGDVAGKGIPAALIMAQTISLFRVFATSLSSPAKVLTRLNKELCKILQARFITAFFVIIDVHKNSFVASCAGHLPLIKYDNKNNNVYEVCPLSFPPLGILEDIEYQDFSEGFYLKDRLLLYTDGVTEAKNKKNEEFGSLRLAQLLLKYKDYPIKEAHTMIIKDITNFFKGLSQYDDMSLILIEHT